MKPPTLEQSQELMVSGAREFALEAHGDQMYGDRPYIVHLDEVADLARALGYQPEVRAGCFLHDVFEDTKKTSADVLAETEVTTPVVEGIIAVTALPGDTMETKIARARSHPIGHVIKVCDSSRNFATTVNNPEELAKDRRLRNLLKYAGSLSLLRADVPTPEDISRYLASRIFV